MSKTRSRQERRRFSLSDREKRLALIKRRGRESRKTRVTPDEDMRIASLAADLDDGLEVVS